MAQNNESIVVNSIRFVLMLIKIVCEYQIENNKNRKLLEIKDFYAIT